jgi:hypothetical protein
MGRGGGGLGHTHTHAEWWSLKPTLFRRFMYTFVYMYLLDIWANKRLGKRRSYISGLSTTALFPFISPASRAATLSPELYKKWPRCVNGVIQLLQPCKLEFSGCSLFGITLIQGINEVFNLWPSNIVVKHQKPVVVWDQCLRSFGCVPARLSRNVRTDCVLACRHTQQQVSIYSQFSTWHKHGSSDEK